MLGCINTELDVDIKKGILFLDKIMDVVQNEGISVFFTPFVIKLKQIYNTGRVSLRKRIKANHELKRTVKSGNSNRSVVAHADTDLILQEVETEEVMNDLEIDKDGNIFDVLSWYNLSFDWHTWLVDSLVIQR